MGVSCVSCRDHGTAKEASFVWFASFFLDNFPPLFREFSQNFSSRFHSLHNVSQHGELLQHVNGPLRILERAVCRDTQQTILCEWTSRPSGIALVIKPVVGDLMMNMRRLKERDQNVHVE